MGYGDLIAHVLEGGHCTEELLRQDARSVNRSARLLLETLSAGRSIYCASDARYRHIAAHIAQDMLLGDGERRLPVAVLDPLPLAAEALLRDGDALLIVAARADAVVRQTLEAARARSVRLVCLLGADAAGALSGNATVVVPQSDPALLALAFLGIGQALTAIVCDGLKSLPPPTESGLVARVIDRDAGESGEGLAEEAALLRQAVNDLPPPVTNPYPTERPRKGSAGFSRRPSGRRERRRANRVHVLDAEVRWSQEGFPDASPAHQPHLLEDMSLTGMSFLATLGQFKIGDVLFLTIDVPAFPSPVLVKGQVRRISLQKSGDGATVGIRFVQWVGEAEDNLRRLVDNEALRVVRRR
ncbi:MAG: PilZ domain-containing protein [Planctomycetes bacterium]|nr:PilZ domain-containing protein [Planctomycetota bacterium]